MKAVKIDYYDGKERIVIHNNVVEVEKKTSNREFKCLCCGKEWTETINSPSILEREVECNLNEYYPKDKIVFCKKSH